MLPAEVGTKFGEVRILCYKFCTVSRPLLRGAGTLWLPPFPFLGQSPLKSRTNDNYTKEHELRLKIDAAPAETGADQFKRAVESVRKSVMDLDCETRGVFTSLRRVETTGIQSATCEAARVRTH